MGALVATSSASIVHTDVRARIATVTLGQNFAEGAFLQALDREGQRTGLLRALPVSGENLRQLYILEGEPQINDKLKEVSPAEAQRLAEMYPDDKAS